jgi:hypothetical protein
LWLSSSARRSGSRAAARLVGPAQRGAEVEQCADVLEARRIPIAGGDGLLEQLEALAAARGEAEHSQVADDDAGDPGGTSLLELLGGQLDGAARIAERRVGEGRGRAPGDPARPDAAEPPLQLDAGLQRVLARILGRSCARRSCARTSSRKPCSALSLTSGWSMIDSAVSACSSCPPCRWQHAIAPYAVRT